MPKHFHEPKKKAEVIEELAEELQIDPKSDEDLFSALNKMSKKNLGNLAYYIWNTKHRG
jgi:hypothetical protein